jgi:hypothetical protein
MCVSQRRYKFSRRTNGRPLVGLKRVCGSRRRAMCMRERRDINITGCGLSIRVAATRTGATFLFVPMHSARAILLGHSRQGSIYAPVVWVGGERLYPPTGRPGLLPQHRAILIKCGSRRPIRVRNYNRKRYLITLRNIVSSLKPAQKCKVIIDCIQLFGSKAIIKWKTNYYYANFVYKIN